MFRFRLQQVLELRERREREVATALAEARGAREEAQTRLAELRAMRETSANGARTTAARPVGELAQMALLLTQLDDHIESAHEAVTAADETVAHVQEALTVALQDRRVLDRLRERHEATHRAESDQRDRRTMDDIALGRYTRNGTA